MSDLLRIDCQEWRELTELFPVEMEVITEMMIEVDEEVCDEVVVH
ncbi:MAG: hypothetical protein U9Q81_03625 [Pseudomonadota bacterium]|nr:hypothetical protein [Pseudomonadota bacterium]